MKDNKLKLLLKWLMKKPIRAILLLYFVGIAWHCMHPMSSVLTGHFDNPRRWYIDENSLNPIGIQLFGTYDLILQTKPIKGTKDTPMAIDSLCDGLTKLNIGIPCYKHSKFEIAKIVPFSSAVVPESEAIVLVVPQFVPFTYALTKEKSPKPDTSDKSRPQLQASLLQLLQRLSTPRTAPWLSKTILIVAPRPKETPKSDTFIASSNLIEETVESFLNVYLGTTDFQRPPLVGLQLPLEFSGALIRSLIVLDMELLERGTQALPTDKETAKTYEPVTGELRILPQGRRGVLPNMDLVFSVRSVYDHCTMLRPQQLVMEVNQRWKIIHLVVHPFREITLGWWQRLKEILPEELHAWSGKLLHLLSFEYSMAFGPYPPHSLALDRGIDSLTIQGVFPSSNDEDDFDLARGNRPSTKQSPQEYPLEMVHRLELVIRCLSNLHERLHHSTSLYLLPVPDRFIKHEEYLIPNLLLLIPLLVRAVGILIDNEKVLQPNTVAAAQALSVSAFWTIFCSLLIDNTPIHVDLGIAGLHNVELLFVYIGVLFVLSLVPGAFGREYTSIMDVRKSIQLSSCLVAACMHLCIAFGHVALAFPSALLWTPLMAFVPVSESPSDLPKKLAAFLFKAICFGLTCPFTFVVPYIFDSFTPYIRYIYIPLHMWFCILFILPLRP